MSDENTKRSQEGSLARPKKRPSEDTAQLKGIADATIDYVNAGDHYVWITSTADGTHGWALIQDPFVFAIAAAACASRRAVVFRSGSHDPNWGDGAGLWEGVDAIAFRREDL
jgi:hypothetical protein